MRRLFKNQFRGLAAEKRSIAMTAEAHSLVEWVNSFGEGNCESLGELSSGALLFKCMQNVIPNLSSGDDNDWGALFLVLTEFCDCSLEQSLNRELIEAGDEEQIARVVVLLLCLAVQRKPNEDVISRITTLQYRAQCDIMFYIEEALAKMKSNALSSGIFTSGVGDVIPALSERTGELETEEESSEVVGETEGEQEACDDPQLMGNQAECSILSGCGPGLSESTPTPTPSRINKSAHRSNLFVCPSSIPRSVSRHKMSRSYYRGLESPAAVQWMQSQKPAQPHMSEAPALSEELLKLQHKVRVLERSLRNEQTLSQEMHSALCQREQEYRNLEADYQRVLVMADKAKELTDVQDELQMMTAALEKSKKHTQRFQREVEEMRTCRDEEMEQRMSEISHLETESKQLKVLLETAVADQLEQKSEVKRLQLSSETAAIAFHAKERECNSLLQLNQEYSTDIRDLRQQTESLKQELVRLRGTSDEKEKMLTEENQTLSLKIAQIQEELATLRDGHKSLMNECESLRQQVTVAEAGSRAMMEQYQTTVEEMEGLRAQCRMVESRLGEAKFQLSDAQKELSAKEEVLLGLQQSTSEQLQRLQTELEEKETEFINLQSHLTVLKNAADEERCKMQKQVVEKAAEYLSLQQSSTEQIRSFEDRLLKSQHELAAKTEEICSLQKMLSRETQRLQQLLSDAQQELNSLREKCSTESEEMAAVKASLEEDLAHLHSELRESQQNLAGKKRELIERETEIELRNNEDKTLKDELQGLHWTVERLERENSELGEKEVVFQNRLQELASRMEEKEQEWLVGKQVLEKQTIELSAELETVKAALCTADGKLDTEQAKWAEERHSWLVQTALLEEQVAALTGELETAATNTQGLEREAEELKGAVNEASSITQALQAEVAAKSTDVMALESTLSEARAESERLREETRRVEALTGTVESLRQQLEEVNREKEQVQKDSQEERHSWLVQTALLEEQVAALTGELETAATNTQGLEREAEELRGAVNEASSITHALQAEVAAKSTDVAALESTLSEARAENEQLREETRRVEALTRTVESLRQQLEEVNGEKERVQKDFEKLSQDSEDLRAKLGAKYQGALAEMERSHQLYCTEMNALQESNTHLQQQQAEASAENAAILQKQSELYKELSTLQETKSEMMDLCRQYESAYNEERGRRQADREQIRKMRTQSFSESENAATEVNSLRRQLSGEKRATTRLGAENRSLKAQVSFLEQKLKDLEKEHLPPPSPPKPSRRGLRSTFIAPPRRLPTHADPRPSTEEFYSQLQHEFDSSTSTQIPTDISDNPSHTLRGETSELTFRSSIFTGIGLQDDENRITELKDRNRRVLPHLKSSYAVELQEKPDNPCILNERTSRPQKRRLVGSESVRLSSTSRLGGHVAEDVLVGEETRKRTTTSRKVAGDLSFSGSPVPTRRRVSEPLTPQTPLPVHHMEASSKWQDPRRATMATGYPLREYLDREENQPELENKPAAMFELNFSPPRARAVPPERLKERLSKQEKPTKPPAISSRTGATRGTSKRTVGVGKFPQQTSRRSALKTKN